VSHVKPRGRTLTIVQGVSSPVHRILSRMFRQEGGLPDAWSFIQTRSGHIVLYAL
jgi:hypothetical protein